VASWFVDLTPSRITIYYIRMPLFCLASTVEYHLNATAEYTSELGAYFEYSENVVVKVFYDDYRSIMEKLQLYRARNINSVSFWRIGQGPPELWNGIQNAGDLPPQN